MYNSKQILAISKRLKLIYNQLQNFSYFGFFKDFLIVFVYLST